MNKGIFILFLWLTTGMTLSFGQTLPDLIPYRKGNLWGFCDQEKNILITPEYDMVDFFSNGRASVSKDKKYGYIDTMGKQIIPVKYSHIGPFKGGKAIVISFWKYGLIDTAGHELFAPEFYSVSQLDSGYILTRNSVGESSVYDAEGALVLESKYRILTIKDGLVLFSDAKAEGVMNLKGEVLIPAKYEDLSLLYSGHVKVRKEVNFRIVVEEVTIIDPEERYDREGPETIIDDATQTITFKVTARELEEMDQYGMGFGESQRLERQGVLNGKGEWVVPLEFEESEFWQDGPGLILVEKNEKMGLCRSDGKVLLPVEYNDIQPFFGASLAVITQNKKYGFVDTHGVIKIPLKYNYASQMVDGFAIAMKESGYGFVKPNGEEVSDFAFQELGYFSEGLAAAKKDGRWGFIDTTGKWVIEPQFSRVISQSKHSSGLTILGFSEGMAKVQKKVPGFRVERTTYITPAGKPLVPFRYEQVELLGHGYAKVGPKTPNGHSFLFGIVDSTGKELIPVQYPYLYPVSKGLFLVGQSSNKDEMSFLRADQEPVDPWELPAYLNEPKYRLLSFGNHGLARVNEGRTFFYMSENGVQYFEE